LICCFLLLFRLCATGLSYSWGVFQQKLYEDGLGSPATLSFIGSITIAMVSPLALICARLVQNMGSRNAALLGSVIFGTGILSGSFATRSVPGMFVTVGFVAGTGVALIFMASLSLFFCSSYSESVDSVGFYTGHVYTSVPIFSPETRASDWHCICRERLRRCGMVICHRSNDQARGDRVDLPTGGCHHSRSPFACIDVHARAHDPDCSFH
jgi:hypothetical protein